LTPEIRLRLAAQIGQKPDATLMELRDWLQNQEAIGVSQQRLSAVILEMGIRVKTKPARQRTG